MEAINQAGRQHVFMFLMMDEISVQEFLRKPQEFDYEKSLKALFNPLDMILNKDRAHVLKL